MWVRSLADADAACGGKAHGLARLIAAGVCVPDGFVIETEAFRSIAAIAAGELDAIGLVLAAASDRIEHAELPAALVDEVSARAGALGRLAVRSSATIEDGDAGTAAGVFSSRTAVRTTEVWPAIRAVWQSALTPLAASYARHRDAAIALGVIVQRFVVGERLVVYTRPPGAPTGDEIWIQRAGRVHRESRNDPRLEPVLAAERAIGATAGADLELVIPGFDERSEETEGGNPTGFAGRAGGSGIEDRDVLDQLERAWVVQARPIVHPTAHVRVPPPPNVLLALGDGRRWTWDIAHNPDPLSLAQAGLVERIERAGVAPWSLRVCAGYLYSTPRRTLAAPNEGDLERLAAEIDNRLAAALDVDSECTLADAIERYVAFYRIWSNELVPLVAANRGAEWVGARPSAVETTLLAAARGEIDDAAAIARLGVLSPAWDVAVPTFAERPGLIHDAIARTRGSLGRGTKPPIAQPDDERARVAADLAERDDFWFARAQWLVRRAILARATELEIAADTVFWLPLDELSGEPGGANRRASGSRAAAARASRWIMPIVVGGIAPKPGIPLRGIGSGGLATGRVVRFASLGSAVVVGSGDVVVTRAITPALAVIVIGCAAIVSETGGPLDHGAALARELDIPCVVGCHDAWSILLDGMVVTVDGTAGTVVVTCCNSIGDEDR